MCPKESCLTLLVSFLRLTAVLLCRNRHVRKFYGKKVPLQLCCWNVRTLIDSEKRCERKTALLGNELARYGIDIAALSETRFAGEDHLVEHESGYTIFWSGKSAKDKREAGVGFAVRNTLLDKIEQPVGVSDRIMKLRIPLNFSRYMTLLSIYAPTLGSAEEDITSFYHALRTVLTNIPKSENVVILGDFNARVGSDYETWNPLGPHGIGNVNLNGLLLLQLCTEQDLVITNTFFYQKKEHKATWFHPQSKHGHLLDFIVCRRSDLRHFCKVKTMRGAECDTDHLMVRAKVKVVIRRKVRFNGVKVPKRIDTSKLKDMTFRDALKSSFDHADLSDCDWESFKKIVFERGADTLGMKVTKHRDWFGDNRSEVNVLLNEKRKAHQNLLSSSYSNRLYYAAIFSQVKSRVQRRLRQIKNEWWSNLSKQMQLAFNRNDMKMFYGLLHQAFGPKSSRVTPLLARDGTTLFKTSDKIMERWVEHFQDLFYNPSCVDFNAVESIPQRDLHPELDIEPSLREVIECMKQVKTGKSPGLDGIPVELLIHGGLNLQKAVHSLVRGVWNNHAVPQDWVDAILVTLYKEKGKRTICDSHRGISLLEVVGKLFARLLLNRLESCVCKGVIPEGQCGFRAGRGTADMIFSARQLIEKCREQRLPLCQVFVDLTKAFDSVNRDALWKVLGKYGCTPLFVDKVRQLHHSMKARVNFNGHLSKEIAIDNGVKQGDVLAPTLFSLYLTAVLWFAFHDCDIGVYFRFRTSGKVFNLRRFQAKTRVRENLVRELLYADDADLVAHSAADMQSVIDRFADACSRFGLTINIAKTKVMFTPIPDEIYVEPEVFVNGKRLEVVKHFTYLGSALSNDGSLDVEINKRISKASGAFGKLEGRVWSDQDLTLRTKLSIYETCVLATLLYGSETWTMYKSQLKLLERFHHYCLRRILRIQWESRTPDTVVLSKANTVSISSMVMRRQMRWAGHLVRMEDSRLPKQLFYGELSSGKRPQCKPRKRFKDCIKENLKCMKIDEGSWEALTLDRSRWRDVVFRGAKLYEKSRVSRVELKRACRKFDHLPADGGHVWVCDVCGRCLLSKAGFVNHQKAHQTTRHRVVPDSSLTSSTSESPEHLCPWCSKVCRSSSGLKRHLKIHEHEIPAGSKSRVQLSCHICQKECKSLAGLKSHLRLHARAEQMEENIEGMALV